MDTVMTVFLGLLIAVFIVFCIVILGMPKGRKK